MLCWRSDGCARSNPRLVGGPREDYKQKPNHGYADTVIDPLGLADQEALGRITEKAGALSDKAQSGDQSDNSDSSQQRVHPKATSQGFVELGEAGIAAVEHTMRHRRSLQLHCDEMLTNSSRMQGFDETRRWQNTFRFSKPDEASRSEKASLSVPSENRYSFPGYRRPNERSANGSKKEGKGL